jgi:hypothetical protein
MKKINSVINILGSIFSIITGVGGIYLYFSDQIIIDKTLLIMISVLALLIFVRLILKEASIFENFFVKVIICIYIYPALAILYYRFVLEPENNDLTGFFIFNMVFGITYYIFLAYMVTHWYYEAKYNIELKSNIKYIDSNEEENKLDGRV